MNRFIPYGKQTIDDDDIQAVVDTLKSDFLTQGPKVVEFEETLCEYTGAKYCVAVSNGTAALHISVAALNIEKGYEGITSPITFAASANCLVYNNLLPVFADIDPKTYNIDPGKIFKNLSKKTKVIIPVHFAGQPVDVPAISLLAKKNNIKIIEDAAHAIGSRYADGSMIGGCKNSDMTIFSFHPVKTMTTGEGGAVTTNNEELYNELLLLRSHGITKDEDKMQNSPGPWYYEMQRLGFNYRITDIQAALGISQLRKIDKFIERRRYVVEYYNKELSEIDWIITPYENPEVKSAFHLYVLQIDFNRIKKTRNQVMRELKNNRIGTQVHYIPVHTHPYYCSEYKYKWGDFPISESYYNQAISLPLYPSIQDDEIKHVIKCIKDLKS